MPIDIKACLSLDGSGSVVMAMLYTATYCTSDNKVAVRKAAILALEVLSNIREDSIDIEVSNIYQYTELCCIHSEMYFTVVL